MSHKSLEFRKILRFFLLTSVPFSVFAATTVLYDPASVDKGPFPSNVLTSADNRQSTGIRIDLPATNTCDPTSHAAVCSNSDLLDQLDGFSVNPRIMVCFSAAIDPGTLKAGIHIAPVSGGAAIPINQIIVDPTSHCAYAKPDHVLDQQSRYLLVVTDAVHDSTGHSVTEDDLFASCLTSRDSYCRGLQQALHGDPETASRVVAASLFTTMSATSWLEKARRFVDAHELPIVLPAGLPVSYQISDLRKMTWIPAQSGLPPQDIPLSALPGVGRVAFGLYFSPNFLNPSTETISFTPSNRPISGPSGYIPVSFHLFLPASPRPLGGYPVVVYGHGLGDSQFGAPTFIASTLAHYGFATLAFEIMGHGYGAGSVVKLTDTRGIVHTVATPGRGVLQQGNTTIGSTDGCIVQGAIAVRDCGLQSAVDLFALVDAIRRTAGLGLQVNPGRIYYVGQSFGSTFGTLFHAVEPNVHAAVINVGGGTSVDIARLAISARPLGEAYLAPLGLLNATTGNYEPPFGEAFSFGFNDNYVYRDEPPVVNTVDGALAIQAAFEAADWLGMLGDPLAFAPHLKTSPLAGVPPKATLFQFAQGDLEVPDPTNSALIRAADGQSTAWYLLFKKAAEEDPTLLTITIPGDQLPSLPHAILSNPTIFDEAGEESIALAEQDQVATFFGSDGNTNPNPNSFLEGPFAGQTLFVIPKRLPERLHYFQLPLLKQLLGQQ